MNTPELKDDQAPDVQKELKALQTVLRKTRRELKLPVFLEGLLWLGATLAAVGLSSLILGLALPEDIGPLVFQSLLALGTTLSVIIGAGFWLSSQRSTDELLDIAAELQRAHPDFRNDLTAALQFAREMTSDSAQRYSQSLANAHIRKTVRFVLGIVDGSGSLAHLVPKRDTQPAWIAFGLGLVSILGVALLFPVETGKLWNTTFGEIEGEVSEATQRPVVGDIDLFFQHPAYTQLPSEFVPFTTGHIQTLIGTEVTLKTFPIMPARSYEMILETEDGERAIPLAQKGGRLEVEFVATKAGKYWFRANMEDGAVWMMASTAKSFSNPTRPRRW